MIVAEGYTDVIAMHQAGLRNTVGLMGTALTEEQVGELSRLAPRVQLALDADGAGQEAMLRAARVAAGRRLELRVVPLPPGTDPADLVAAEGARAMQRLVDASVPFVRFRVERELSTGDLGSAEGKDAVIGALRPVFAQIPPSALREELIALVADRTDLSPALVGSWLAQGAGSRARHGGGGRGGRACRARRKRPGGASPGSAARRRGARRRRPWASTSFSRVHRGAEGGGRRRSRRWTSRPMFTDDLTRRAARHLRDHIARAAEGHRRRRTRELSTLIAKLSVRAAQALGSTDSIEGASINMELMRVRPCQSGRSRVRPGRRRPARRSRATSSAGGSTSSSSARWRRRAGTACARTVSRGDRRRRGRRRPTQRRAGAPPGVAGASTSVLLEGPLGLSRS